MSRSTPVAGNIATIYDVKATVDMFKGGAFGYAVEKGIVDVTDKLKGQRGSTISVPKVSLLSGVGTGSSGTLDNHEESLNNSAQTMVVDEFCHATLNPTDLTIDYHNNYIPWNEASQKLLVGFMVSRKDAGFFQQLAGAYPTSITVDGTAYTGTDRTFATFLNTVLTPSSNRIVRAGGAATDEALTSADTMALDLIDDGIQKLEDNNPSAETLDGGFLDFFCSTSQAKSLIQDSASSIQLSNIGLSLLSGGKDSQTLMQSGYSGNAGMQLVGTYRNVRIWSCKRVAKGVHSSSSAGISTVQRGVLCGRNAAMYASYFGIPSPKSPAVRMSSMLKDYNRSEGMSIHTIDGLVKNQLNSEDQAVVVISTYGA